MRERPLRERVAERIREWNVTVQDTVETENSVLAFGTRDTQSVVLKVLRAPGDEWRAGEILEAFEGRGVVCVYAHIPGALLLERLNPGTSLVPLVLSGRDQDATEILADVMQRMSAPCRSVPASATVSDWGRGFERHRAAGDTSISAELVAKAAHLYMELSATQRQTRLLHGDLQHSNVLFDRDRGWLAIDPKGVVGELEYELGASLRNPKERPDLFASPRVVERRLQLFAERLRLDAHRALRWSFAQAVLSAIWSVEDGSPVDATNSSLRLAKAIEPLLD